MATLSRPPAGLHDYVFPLPDHDGFWCEVRATAVTDVPAFGPYVRVEVPRFGRLTLQVEQLRLRHGSTPACLEISRTARGALTFSVHRARSIVEAQHVLEWWPLAQHLIQPGHVPVDFDAYLAQLRDAFRRLRAAHGRRPTHAECAAAIGVARETSEQRLWRAGMSWKQLSRSW